MTLDVSIELEVEPYLALLNKLGKDQMPFAVATTLTDVAKIAEADVKTVIPRRFNLTNKRAVSGVKRVNAKKGDWPNPHALIGHLDQYMVDHELGGIRRGRNGGYRMIPTKRVKRGKRGKIDARERPRRLISNKRVFFKDQSLRLKDTRRKKHRAPTMYLGRKQVRIRPRFGFRGTVESAAARHMQPIFTRNMKAALRSRRA